MSSINSFFSAPDRVTQLSEVGVGQASPGPVVYWTTREHRAVDNWSLTIAAELAAAWQQPLVVVVALRPDLRAVAGTSRWFEFMLGGLVELEQDLKPLGVPLHFLIGDPVEEVVQLCQDIQAGAVVVDFYPLRVYRSWHQKLVKGLKLPILEVDAHNVVPCRLASPKQEYSARTFRPKLQRLLPQYLSHLPGKLPNLPPWSRRWPGVDWGQCRRRIKVDTTVPPVTWLRPGTAAAQTQLQLFLQVGISHYDQWRNAPERSGQSGLSPYLHFGHISTQRVAVETAQKSSGFFEELVVRRELAENYCWFQEHYDRVTGFPNWAQKTLSQHQLDPRPYQYSQSQLTQAETHDPAWNAAQQQLLFQGKMHGYMRMYWAKKLLEWSESPAAALEIAIDLNDRYELDGRDPNGYVGVAWALGGLHDRPWPERPIFGTVRSMMYSGLKRKFDIDAYIAQCHQLSVS